MASMCSLAAAHHRRAGRTASSATQIGEDALETWSRGLELFNAERAEHDPAQFCDVDYFDFIKDPIATSKPSTGSSVSS